MRNSDGMTPKEAAHDIVTGWIQGIHRGYTRDLDNACTTPTGKESEPYRRKVQYHLARIHNRLMEQVNLDGIWLEEERRDE